MSDQTSADGPQPEPVLEAVSPPSAKRPFIPTLRPWARWLSCGFIGVIAGFGFAVHGVRAGALGSGVAIGPWTTGTDFGSAEASAETRAVVALRGLLALPASEARYYTAATDDAGQPLSGHCSYRISGGPLPARWWSLTVYDGEGYLVKNDEQVYSLESAALGADEQVRWNVAVAPDRQVGHWLPSGGIDHVELTLRTYLPADGGTGNLARNQLPAITREACR
jgi:hypothetical protein